jgi:peptidylprolyl isomerase
VNLASRYGSACSHKAGVYLILGLLLILTVFGSACNGKKAGNSNGSDLDTAEDANIKKGVKPEPDAEAAVIDTDYGRIVIELYPNVAPEMVKRFKQLTREGIYNGTTFHRINPQLGIIQGGDPLSKDNNPANDGTGNSQYPNVPAEFSDIPYDRGIVGAARQGGGMGMNEEQAKNTANSQFYITLKRVPDFDKRYTVFGKVIEGINNADIIANAPTDAGTERPADKIVVKSVTLQPRGNFPGGK